LATWINGKLAYRRTLRERGAERQRQAELTDRAEFRSRVVEAAFYNAIARYTVVPQPLRLALFRPRLKPMVEFGPGRAINKHKRRIFYDNGWAPYARRVDVFETPGDHDGMVLEPNVRILASRLRKVLDEVELATSKSVRASAVAAKNEPTVHSQGPDAQAAVPAAPAKAPDT
jgi:thioesterase domain-containing protein